MFLSQVSDPAIDLLNVDAWNQSNIETFFLDLIDFPQIFVVQTTFYSDVVVFTDAAYYMLALSEQFFIVLVF